MLFWGIIVLVCLGYFLHEAARAPVIEDDEPHDVEEATRGRMNTGAHKLQAAIHGWLAGKKSDQ